MLSIQGLVLLAASLLSFALQVWALVDAVSRRSETFPAANKMTKTAWLLILGLAVLAHMLFWTSPINILNIAGTVAAIVYLVDVRPAVRALTRR